MSRSSWKLPYVSNSFFRIFKKVSDKPLNVWSRGSMLLYPHMNKNLKIYNGRKFVSVTVKKTLLGYYSGDFCMSKFLGRKIHLRKKKKKATSKR